MTLARFHIPGPLLLLAVFVGCDRHHPLAPGIEAAVGGQPGPTVPAPSNSNAVAVSSSQINVGWQDNSSNETGFEVYLSTTGPSGSFGAFISLGANVTSYGHTGLAASTQYCYKVRAFRKTGSQTSYSAFSITACATTLPPPAPAAPSGTDAKPSSSSAVEVSWVDKSSNEGGFRVERSLDAGSTWITAGTVGSNVASFQDPGRSSEQQVCYRVVAFNAGGDSPPSNADCTAPPAAPTGLTATAEADQPAIDLTWKDNSAVEDGYEVLQESDFGGIVVELPANTTSYRDVSVGSNATYFYRVRAKKDGGFSDLSDVASAQCVAASCLPACNGSLDCGLGYICVASLCVPHCNDGVLDGDESDVDCGGNACVARCLAGQTCSVNGDCASGICNFGICQ
jgi:hypothetical protein